jgi:hypothetical protein
VADQTSRTRPWSAPPQAKGPAVQVTELKDLVVSYAKQETVDPLKTLGSYMGYGLAGSVCIGAGISLLLLALLRGLQQIDAVNDPGELDGGTFSWAPYFIVMLVGLVIAGLFLRTLYKMTQKQGMTR